MDLIELRNSHKHISIFALIGIIENLLQILPYFLQNSH